MKIEREVWESKTGSEGWEKMMGSEDGKRGWEVWIGSEDGM